MSERPEANTVEIVDDTCSTGGCEFKDTYRVKVSCGNCGWEGEMRSTCGHRPNTGLGGTADCPRCECSPLYQGDFVVRESVGGSS